MIQMVPITGLDVSKVESGPEYPARAWKLAGGPPLTFGGRGDTVYGYTYYPLSVNWLGRTFELCAGMYFALPGPVALSGRHAVVINRRGYVGLPAFGGPIEERGRLLYIDGCSDSLLIGPPKKGDPCLNHLHFPPGISQTMHTHPTARVGMVARGSGKCVTPTGELALEAGMCWYLEAGDPHCFHTAPGETMDVIAWHPDTDVGPTDESHPMVNRTYVDGVSAAGIAAIRSTELK